MGSEGAGGDGGTPRALAGGSYGGEAEPLASAGDKVADGATAELRIVDRTR